MLTEGAAMLAQTLKASASDDVVYSRGADSITIAATPGEQTFANVDASGLLTEVRSRDFIITAADLVLVAVIGPSPDTPRPGDTIDHAGRRYEVLEMPGEPAFRYLNPDRLQMRIHTKEIGATP